MYYELFPDVLRLVDESGTQCGIAIRFNAEFDTIFMDLESLRSLYDYTRPAQPVPGAATEGGFGPSMIARKRNLTGFNLIRRLKAPLPASPTVDGIEYLRYHIFTGLIHPVEEDFGAFPRLDTAHLRLLNLSVVSPAFQSQSEEEILIFSQCVESSKRLYQPLEEFLKDNAGLRPEWIVPLNLGAHPRQGLFEAMVSRLKARVTKESEVFFSITSSLGSYN